MTSGEEIDAMLLPEGGVFEDEQIATYGEYLENLSNEDRVSFRDRNAAAIASADLAQLLVVAGLGTGKSYLFMDRLRHWLNQFPGESIYVSTFVRKLAQDLANDVDTSRLSPAEKRLVTVSTLHSLARSLVERSGGTAALPMKRHIKMIGTIWKEVVWGDVLSLTPTANNAQTVREFERQFHELNPQDHEPWPALRASFFRLCQFYNALGFADLILHATEALRDNPELDSHRLWIVDEFQDFNPAEEELVRTCFDSSLGVLMAGDDDQALYQDLKSSHPDIIRTHYGDETIPKAMLPYCGRCSYHICMGATVFLRRRRDDDSIRKVFVPLVVDESAQPIQVVACSSARGAVGYVEEFINAHRPNIEQRRDAIRSGSAKDPFLLVLTYQRDARAFIQDDAAGNLDALMEEWRLEAAGPGPDYFVSLTYLRQTQAPEDNFAMRKILFYENVPEETVHNLLQEALERNISLAQVLHPEIGSARDKSEAVTARVMGDSAPEHIAEALSQLIPVEDPARLAADLEAFPIGRHAGALAQEEEEVETAGTISPVERMPMIRAKGLSADHVILLGFDPINMSQVSPQLFFVAMTRARSSLHLITALGARGASQPHEFLADIPEEHCDYLKETTAGQETFGSRVEYLEYFERRRAAIARSRGPGRRRG